MSNVHETSALDPEQSVENPQTPDDIAPEPASPPLKPPIALRSDGRLLIGLDAFEGRSIGDRETWVGVVLSHKEEAFLCKRCEDAGHEATALVAGQLPLAKKE